jgi:hypothetical protein
MTGFRSLVARLKTLLETKPAALLYGLAAILPPVLDALGVSKGYIGAVVTIAAALAAAVTGLKARPAEVPVILGAAGAVLSAFTAFGLKLNPQATAEILSGLQIALAFAFHLSLSPASAPVPVIRKAKAAPTA